MLWSRVIVANLLPFSFGSIPQMRYFMAGGGRKMRIYNKTQKAEPPTIIAVSLCCKSGSRTTPTGNKILIFKADWGIFANVNRRETRLEIL